MNQPHLDRLTTSRLAELYNAHADRPVKRFASKTAAILRVERLCAERGLRLVPTGEDEAALVPAGDDSPPQAPQAAAGDDPEAADTTPPRRRRGGEQRAPQAAEPDVPEAAVIRVVELPTAREGSHRAARMAVLRDGMTVGDYLDAAHEANGGRRARGRYRSDVRRLVERGAIRLET